MARTGSNIYWPVFVSVAALATAATWRFAPQFGANLSDSARFQIRRLVGVFMGQTPETGGGRAAFLVSPDEMADIVAVNKAFAEEKTAAEVKALDRAARPSLRRVAAPITEAMASKRTSETAAESVADAVWSPDAVAPAPSVATATTVSEPSKAPTAVASDGGVSDSPASDDVPPVRLGIVPTTPMDGDWCVLKQVTQIEKLDGTPLGTVKGGRVFLVERRFNSDDGLMLIGNFTPKPLSEPVQLAARNVVAFTGRPEKLSENQRNSLRKYYELRGQAEERWAELTLAAARKSPYLAAAAAALKELREKSEAAEKNARNAEAKRQATYDLAALRAKVQDLNKKHRDWKAQHAAQQVDPDQDPLYRELVNARRPYAAAIPGLAYE